MSASSQAAHALDAALARPPWLPAAMLAVALHAMAAFALTTTWSRPPALPSGEGQGVLSLVLGAGSSGPAGAGAMAGVAEEAPAPTTQTARRQTPATPTVPAAPEQVAQMPAPERPADSPRAPVPAMPEDAVRLARAELSPEPAVQPADFALAQPQEAPAEVPPLASETALSVAEPPAPEPERPQVVARLTSEELPKPTRAVSADSGPVPPPPAHRPDRPRRQTVAAAPPPVAPAERKPTKQAAVPAVTDSISPPHDEAAPSTSPADGGAVPGSRDPARDGVEVASRALGSGQPSTAASGGGQAGTAGSQGDTPARADFMRALQAWLERHKEYPARARSRRQQGVVLLNFTMDRAGAVLDFEIARSSGHRLLDRAVERLIRRAQPLPVLPGQWQRARLELQVPIRFSLR